MASQTSVLSGVWFEQEDQSRLNPRLKRGLALSLVLHVVVLLVAVGLRLPHQGERPLASVEVSLVSLPTPVTQAEPAKPMEPTKVSEPKPAPTPLVKAKAVVPSTAPSVAPPIGERRRDMLQDLQLPPDAPKFGDFSPAPSVARPQQLAKAKVLDIPRIPDMAQPPVAKIPQRSSVSDDLNRELEEELKKIKQFQPAAKLDIPKEVKPNEASIKPGPQEASVPANKTPQTQLKTSGSSGSNPYWARVEAIIKSHWEPPPIDVNGQTYSVVVKFRFFRNGTVKDVGVQRTSGNSYFDMAGHRAVLKPGFLPPFPAEMTETYQDVEMLFRVGEAVG